MVKLLYEGGREMYEVSPVSCMKSLRSRSPSRMRLNCEIIFRPSSPSFIFSRAVGYPGPEIFPVDKRGRASSLGGRRYEIKLNLVW